MISVSGIIQFPVAIIGLPLWPVVSFDMRNACAREIVPFCAIEFGGTPSVCERVPPSLAAQRCEDRCARPQIRINTY
jgi:hypothetical protein